MRRAYPEGPAKDWPDDMNDWPVSLVKDRATTLFGNWTNNWADHGRPIDPEERDE